MLILRVHLLNFWFVSKIFFSHFQPLGLSVSIDNL